MDLLLVTIGFICMIVGLLGSFLPGLPGVSLSWLGLLLLYLTSAIPMNYWVLGITLIITLTLSILDYIIPAKGTKKFGGSYYGVWGTNIGLVLGFLSPIPFGFIIGAFLGAFIGEIIYNSNDHHRAFKAATGSFIGYIASSFIQFITCVAYFGIFIWTVWKYKSGLF
jgi:uncharacterized protein